MGQAFQWLRSLVFTIQIKPQNMAPVSQIGGGISQVIFRTTQFVFPKRHDLHQALRTHSRHGVAVKMALHFDDGEYQLGG